MSLMDTAIALDKLPAPEVVESLDFEVVLAALKTDLQGRLPELPVVDLLSEPVVKLLEVCAYREVLLRQRINDSARAVMLAYAGGSDLDHLAALFDVQRGELTPGQSDHTSPVLPAVEQDERLRHRTRLSLEGLSTAGPVGAYKYHALSASPEVKDVAVDSPQPGQVRVTILATSGDGVPTAALLTTVEAYLTADDRRPLTDHVIVQPAHIQRYAVLADLLLDHGPDAQVVLASARQAARDYIDNQHRLGQPVTRGALYAALHQQGVRRVKLREPATDIENTLDQAAWCESLTITQGDRYD